MQVSGQPAPAPLPTFYQAISSDEDSTQRAVAAIASGAAGVADKASALLLEWERRYKRVWDQDKEAYMRRWAGQGGTALPRATVGAGWGCAA